MGVHLCNEGIPLRSHIYSRQAKKRPQHRFKDPVDPLKLVLEQAQSLSGGGSTQNQKRIEATHAQTSLGFSRRSDRLFP
jgi:hypothetical protein